MFSLSSPPPRPSPAAEPYSSFFGATKSADRIRPRLVPFHAHVPPTPSPLRSSRNANANVNSNLNLNYMPTAFLNNTASVDDETDDSTSLLSSSPVSGPAGGARFVDENGIVQVGGNKFGTQSTDVEKRDGQACGFGIGHLQKTPEGKATTNYMSDTNMNGNGTCSSEEPFPLITPPDSGSNATNANTRLVSAGMYGTPNTGSWERRSRDAGAAAALARHAAQGRDKKKTQFLDRIRRRRDDSRTDIYGDQVLRMDFVRERRQWEEEMNRRALLEQGVLAPPEEEEEDDGGDAAMRDNNPAIVPLFDQSGCPVPEAEEDEADLSPTEIHDVDDALVEYYARIADMGGDVQDVRRGDNRLEHSEAGGNGNGDDDDFLIDDNEVDMEEYDQLFEELVAQSQHRHGTSQTQWMACPTDAGRQQHQQQQHQAGQNGGGTHVARDHHDSSMDLS
ncbi:hypothetical protein ABEF95_007275 [Exophiala dermatitidis]